MSFLRAVGDRASLRETIADALRSAIITGEMQPGRVYSAATLARQLGVSATPVREAMIGLARDGMVEAVRNKGFRVVALRDAELDQITEVRRLIEVPAVAGIAAGPRHAAAGSVREPARAIVAAAGRGDLAGYLRADREFHLGLLSLSGNDVLVRIVGDLRSRSRLYGLQALAAGGGLTDSAREHERLLDLVLAGDADGAPALMERHLRHIRGSWAGLPESG